MCCHEVFCKIYVAEFSSRSALWGSACHKVPAILPLMRLLDLFYFFLGFLLVFWGQGMLLLTTVIGMVFCKLHTWWS